MRIQPALILPEDAGATAEPKASEPPNEWWRYYRFQPAKDGKPDGDPYWFDSKTMQRIDRPPWETGGG